MEAVRVKQSVLRVIGFVLVLVLPLMLWIYKTCVSVWLAYILNKDGYSL